MYVTLHRCSMEQVKLTRGNERDSHGNLWTVVSMTVRLAGLSN